MQESLCPALDAYLDLVEDTEAPTLAHRWSFLTSFSSTLHRRTCFPRGIGNVYPNMYTILVGSPGSRKSSAIDLAVGIIQDSGYKNIASGKTSPEQFLLDLKTGFASTNMDATALLDYSVDNGLDGTGLSSNCLINGSELQTFMGNSNMNFISLLTDLWDNKQSVPYRIRSGVQELVTAPTVSLLGGATEATFKKIFPIDTIDQGLLSRFNLVFCSGQKSKIFDPAEIYTAERLELVDYIKQLNSIELPRELNYSPAAYEFSKVLYETGKPEVVDSRFNHYHSRRYVHYVKLAVVIAVLNLHTQIEVEDCLLANTILAYTEKFMPQALGEFGMDKEAEKTEKLFHLLLHYPKGLTATEIVNKSINTFQGSGSLVLQHLMKLRATQRIEQHSSGGETKFVVIQRIVASDSKLVNLSLLREYNENPTFYNVLDAYDAQAKREEQELIEQLEAELLRAKPELKLGKGKIKFNLEGELI